MVCRNPTVHTPATIASTPKRVSCVCLRARRHAHTQQPIPIQTHSHQRFVKITVATTLPSNPALSEITIIMLSRHARAFWTFANLKPILYSPGTGSNQPHTHTYTHMYYSGWTARARAKKQRETHKNINMPVCTRKRAQDVRCEECVCVHLQCVIGCTYIDHLTRGFPKTGE